MKTIMLLLGIGVLLAFSCKKKDTVQAPVNPVAAVIDSIKGSYQTTRICYRDSGGYRFNIDTTNNVTIDVVKTSDSTISIGAGGVDMFLNQSPSNSGYSFVYYIVHCCRDILSCDSSLRHFYLTEDGLYNNGGTNTCIYTWDR